MNHAQSDEINYWPAYVDALINVVLNLLFLVGVFTIGLVSLNEQALFAEQEANKRKLASLELASSVQERRKIVDELLRALPPAPVMNKVEQPNITEILFRSTPRLQTLVDSDAAKGVDTSSGLTIDQFADVLAKDGELTRISFELNQYKQPANWTWPYEIKLRASQNNWSLYVIADPTNARLSREAYARLVFVRSTLLHAGASPEHIQMKVTPAQNVVALPQGIERTVWVVERAR